MKKVWSILVHFGSNTWENEYERKRCEEMEFDRDVWEKIVAKCVEYGIDTIVFALGEGLIYKSHPELAVEGSWDPEELRKEVQRLKKLGIRMIPKFNFSAYHDPWLGEYGKSLISTPTYYKVCKDLIEEAYDIFDHPDYIHLGLDEEFPHTATAENHFRVGEQLFKDYIYLIDCVRATGARPWIWGSTCIHYEDTWRNYIDKDIILAKGQYYEYDPANWTRIEDQGEAEKEYYWGERFKKSPAYKIYLEMYGDKPMEYIEQDPSVARNIKWISQCIKEGYQMFIVPSNVFLKSNTYSAVRYYCGREEEKGIVGFMGASWKPTTKKNEAAILEEIELLGKAKKEFYGA